MTFLDLLVLVFVTYRVTRLFQLDSLFEATIDRALLIRDDLIADQAHDDQRETFRHFVARKFMVGVTCAWCFSVWTAAGVLTFWTLISDYEWTWVWLMHWPAIAAGAMVVYRWTDPDATEVKMVDD